MANHRCCAPLRSGKTCKRNGEYYDPEHRGFLCYIHISTDFSEYICLRKATSETSRIVAEVEWELTCYRSPKAGNLVLRWIKTIVCKHRLGVARLAHELCERRLGSFLERASSSSDNGLGPKLRASNSAHASNKLDT